MHNKKLDIICDARASHFTTARFDHIFRHMESIWTTHEDLLINNLIFVRKLRKGKIQDDNESAETQDRSDVRDTFEIFKVNEEEHVEAERFAVAIAFTSGADRYFTRERNPAILCRCSSKLVNRASSNCIAPINCDLMLNQEYRSDDRDREISDNRVNLV